MSLVRPLARSLARPLPHSLIKGGGGYEAEATALFARFTTPPDDVRKGLINTCIKSLKDAGVWSKLDALYVTAAADAQAARRNWIADQFNLLAVNSPTFTVDRGYAGDGSSSYLATGWDPATNGAAYQQNSASLFAWSRTDTRVDGAPIIGGDASGGGAAYINPWNLSIDSVSHGLNSTGANSGAPGSATGFFLLSRESAAGYAIYRNQTHLATRTIASGSPTITDFRLLGSSGGLSARQVANGGFGGGVSVGEEAALYTAILTYLQAVGAA